MQRGSTQGRWRNVGHARPSECESWVSRFTGSARPVPPQSTDDPTRGTRRRAFAAGGSRPDAKRLFVRHQDNTAAVTLSSRFAPTPVVRLKASGSGPRGIDRWFLLTLATDTNRQYCSSSRRKRVAFFDRGAGLRLGSFLGDAWLRTTPTGPVSAAPSGTRSDDGSERVDSASFMRHGIVRTNAGSH